MIYLTLNITLIEIKKKIVIIDWGKTANSKGLDLKGGNYGLQRIRRVPTKENPDPKKVSFYYIRDPFYGVFIHEMSYSSSIPSLSTC